MTVNNSFRHFLCNSFRESTEDINTFNKDVNLVTARAEKIFNNTIPYTYNNSRSHLARDCFPKW